MRLELYVTAACPHCADLRDELEWQGKTFVEYDVQLDADAKARLLALSGGSMVPVLVEDGVVTSIGWKGRGCYA